MDVKTSSRKTVGGLVVVLGLIASSLGSLPALAAETVDHGFLSFGPRATYFVPKNDNWEEGKFYGGAQLRAHFLQALAIEGSADYRRDHFGSTRVDTYPVQVSLLAYLFPSSPLTPFGLVGGGWYYTHVKGPGGFDDTQNRFGAHAGGGLQFFINRNWSTDATYRYIWLEDIRSKDNNLLDKKFDDRGHMVTLGINFHF